MKTHFTKQTIESTLTMGCCWNKAANADTERPQTVAAYSWDAREAVDRGKYMLEGLQGQLVIRETGQIDGEQFLIRDCSHCIIYLLDVIDSIILEDCGHCKITVGPTKGSIFMRSCHNSVILSASGQFRLRDCRNLNLFIYTATSPILESSASIYLNCFQLNYFNLEEQFLKAELPIYNNQWSKVHDFTPVAGDSNYILASTSINEFFPSPGKDLLRLSFSYEAVGSVVPVTSAYFLLSREEHYLLILVLFNENQSKQARQVYVEMQKTTDDEVHPMRLLHTQQVEFDKVEGEQVFSCKNHLEKSKLGSSIGFLYSGVHAETKAKQVCEKVFAGKDLYLLTSCFSTVQLFLLKHPNYDTY
ncbi:protein XRP2-like isoform X2 [Rhodnius prolixus]|uniref:protein XRP2-like isoform X2 n=1 Tax=Rhodnius prolixus TaxID=13249 RepID=UPI003D18B6EC